MGIKKTKAPFKFKKLNSDKHRESGYEVSLFGDVIGYVWKFTRHSYRGAQGMNSGIRTTDYYPTSWSCTKEEHFYRSGYQDTRYQAAVGLLNEQQQLLEFWGLIEVDRIIGADCKKGNKDLVIQLLNSHFTEDEPSASSVNFYLDRYLKVGDTEASHPFKAVFDKGMWSFQQLSVSDLNEE